MTDGAIPVLRAIDARTRVGFEPSGLLIRVRVPRFLTPWCYAENPFDLKTCLGPAPRPDSHKAGGTGESSRASTKLNNVAVPHAEGKRRPPPRPASPSAGPLSRVSAVTGSAVVRCVREHSALVDDPDVTHWPSVESVEWEHGVALPPRPHAGGSTVGTAMRCSTGSTLEEERDDDGIGSSSVSKHGEIQEASGTGSATGRQAVSPPELNLSIGSTSTSGASPPGGDTGTGRGHERSTLTSNAPTYQADVSLVTPLRPTASRPALHAVPPELAALVRTACAMDLAAAPVDGDSWLTGTLVDLVCMQI